MPAGDPAYQLQVIHGPVSWAVGDERGTQRWYRQAKETKCGEKRKDRCQFIVSRENRCRFIVSREKRTDTNSAAPNRCPATAEGENRCQFIFLRGENRCQFIFLREKRTDTNSAANSAELTPILLRRRRGPHPPHRPRGAGCPELVGGEPDQSLEVALPELQKEAAPTRQKRKKKTGVS